MSCNCKNGGTMQEILESTPNKSENNVVKYVLKSTLFLISLIFLPAIIGLVIWIMFKTIVLNKSIDAKPMLLSLLNSLQKNDEDDELDDEEFISLTDDDVILMEAEDITNK